MLMRIASRIIAASAAAPPLHCGVSAAAAATPIIANLQDRARQPAEPRNTGLAIDLIPTICVIESLGIGTEDLDMLMQLQLEQPHWFTPTCHYELAVIEEWVGQLIDGAR